MQLIARALSLNTNAMKELQKNLRNEKHATTSALKAIGVMYTVTGKNGAKKTELVKAA